MNIFVVTIFVVAITTELKILHIDIRQMCCNSSETVKLARESNKQKMWPPNPISPEAKEGRPGRLPKNDPPSQVITGDISKHQTIVTLTTEVDCTSMQMCKMKGFVDSWKNTVGSTQRHTCNSFLHVTDMTASEFQNCRLLKWFVKGCLHR